jgi:RecA-family ATPase
MKSEPQFWGIDEFVSFNFPDPLYVIEPLLPRGGIGILYGKQGTGKSALAMTLIRDILEAKPFVGRYMTHGERRAVYVSVDMPEQAVQDRLRKMTRPEYDGRFAAVVHHAPINSLGVRADAEWAQRIRAMKPDLVVVDTLHKVHFLDENASSTPPLIYNAWRGICGVGPAILFIHHDKKDVFAGGQRADVRDDETLRGSSAWQADSDLGIRMTGNAANATVSFPRLRFCDPQNTILMQMNTSTLLFEIARQRAGEMASTMLAARPGATAEQLTAALQRAGVPLADAESAAAAALANCASTVKFAISP